MQSYENFLKSAACNLDTLRDWCKKHKIDFKSFSNTLPPCALQSKDDQQKIEMMPFFNLTEPEINYEQYGIQFLNMSVNEAMFSLMSPQAQLSKVYKNTLFKNTAKVFYLLSKIKTKPLQLASILSHFLLVQNNEVNIDRIKNILVLFLFTECWQLFNGDQQNRQNETIRQIIGQAFHRIFYLLYDKQERENEIFLVFLLNSNFIFHEYLQTALTFHLMALHKLKKSEQKQQMTKLIEKIWKQKMGGFKINNMYIDQNSIFMKPQQKTEKIIQAYESKNIKKYIESEKAQSNSIPKQSKQLSIKRLKNKALYNWVAIISEDIKKLYIENVYLLIDGFKQFCLRQYEGCQPIHKLTCQIMKVIVNLIKKMQKKIHYRLGGSSLCKGIYIQIWELIDSQYVKNSLYSQIKSKDIPDENFNIQILGIFQLCTSNNGTVDIKKLIKFHEINGFEESLSTIMHLKLINNEQNCNIFHQQIYQFHKHFSNDSFQAKVYGLYQLHAKQQKLDDKTLLMIAQLMELKNNNILHNLLANYLYVLFMQKQSSRIYQQIESYRILLNSEIENSVNKQRGCLLLLMVDVLRNFERQQNLKFGSTSLTASTNCFQLLRRKENSDFFMTYSNVYYQHGYFKEALYFLQLGAYFNLESENEVSIKKKAINIYQKLYLSFRNFLPFIQKKQNMKQQLQIPEKPQKLNIQKALSEISRLIDHLNRQKSFFKGEIIIKNQLSIWQSIYCPVLQLFIEKISGMNDINQIYSNILNGNIIYRIINAKMEIILSSTLDNYNYASIINEVQQLQSCDDQITFYQFLLQDLKVQQTHHKMQNLFLDKLLKNKCNEKLLLYLRSNLLEDCDPITQITTHHLCYLIKFYYSDHNYPKALSILHILYERKKKISNIIEMYLIQLSCKCICMLSYTLEESLLFIKNKCLGQSIKNQKNLKYLLDFYFKIFRMIFNRYTFQTKKQNVLLMEIFFQLIKDNQILDSNQLFLNDSIFYLIRFVIQKFYCCAEIAQQGQNMMQFFKDHTLNFIPFINYLLKNISIDNEKAEVIEIIIIKVLSKHPHKCVWIIAFLYNFEICTFQKEMMSQDEKKEIARISSISKKLKILLKDQEILFHSHLNWINNLIVCSLQESNVKLKKIQQNKLMEVPSNLLFIFKPEYYIKKLIDCRVLNKGLSSPLQMTFQLISIVGENIQQVKVILKNSSKYKHYRTQSNTIGFLQQLGLIDSDITYRIQHLSKYLVMIEYVQSQGTLNSVMNQYYDINMIGQNIINIISTRQKISNEKRALELYDIHKNTVKNPLSRILYGKSIDSIRDWWIKISNFVRTHAQWSYLGYIIGLGDRHLENILLTYQSKLVHIDFQYIFDAGFRIDCPQWIPFRLTHCLTQSLGVLGVFGLYYAQMINIAHKFQENEANVWRALSHFTGFSSTSMSQLILNRSKFTNLKVQCCQDGISKIINNATDPQLLRSTFTGWGAFF